MAEQEWEYCSVNMWYAEERKRKWYYECALYFGGERHSLADYNTCLGYNPFRRAMVILGRRGWELVSVQHGCDHYGRLDWSTASAYYKRPIVAGRAIDQPKVDGEEW